MKKIKQIFRVAIIASFFLAFISNAYAQQGAALNFDGTNDYVVLPNNSIIPQLSTGEVTVSAWINMKSKPQWATIIKNWGNSAGAFHLGLDGTTGKISIYITQSNGTAISVVSPNSLALNTWHNIAFSANGNTLKLYENGGLVGSAAYDGTLKTSFLGTFIGVKPNDAGTAPNGSTGSAAGFWNGSIDELRIWKRGLADCEISTAMNCELSGTQTGLLAYYKFNQGVNNANNAGITSLTDASGNGYNGTLTNFALTGTTSNWIANGGVTTGVACGALPTITHNVTTQTQCGGSYTWSSNGQTYTTSGTYVYTYNNASGCASADTLKLTIASPSHNVTTASACNSYTWSSNGQTYTTSGTYVYTYNNASGCASADTLKLIIKQNYTITASVGANGSISPSGNTTVCQGDNQYYTFTPNAGYKVDNVVIDGISIGSVSDYSFIGVTTNHTIGVSFTVQCDPTTSTTNLSICSPALPYLWNGITFTATGSQTVHFTNAGGCDSAATLNLTVKVDGGSSTDTIVLCSSSLPYSWNGINIDSAGTYSKTISLSGSCDSVIYLVVNVVSIKQSTTNVSICSNAFPYSWNGISINGAGTYTKTFTNVGSCDSIANLVVTVAQNKQSTTDVSICSNALPYSWNGNSYNTFGTYVVHLISNEGCDSAATLNLTVSQSKSSLDYYHVCSYSFPFYWNGIHITQTGTYSKTITNIGGCDSIATLIVDLRPTYHSTASVTICQSDLPYTFDTTGFYTFYSGGIYVMHFSPSYGCDSIITLTLTVNPATASRDTVMICQSQLPYSWNGIIITAAGTYTKNFIKGNKNGCDSTATLVLIFKPTVSSVTNLTVCQSSLPYMWNGNSCASSGTYIAHLTSVVYGCDSTATLNLRVTIASSSTSTYNICPTNLPLTWNGLIFNAAGTQTAHLTNAAGCDSAATLVLNVLPGLVSASVAFTTTDSICFNSPYTLIATPVFYPNVQVPDSLLTYTWYQNNSIKSSTSKILNGDKMFPGDAFRAIVSYNAPACGTYKFTPFVYPKIKTPTTQNLPEITIGNRVANYYVNNIRSICTIGESLTASVNVTNGVWINSNPSVIGMNNGANSKIKNLVGLSAGTSDISYKINLSNGCDYAVKFTITLDNTTIAPITLLSPTCSNADITLTTATPNITWASVGILYSTYSYASYSGNSSYVTFPSGQLRASTVTVRATYNNNSCLRTRDYTFNVLNPQTLPAITGQSSVCVGSSIQLSNASVGGSWSSIAGRATIDNAGNVTGTSAGTAVIQYSKLDNNSCIASVEKDITTYPLPAVPSISFAPGTSSISGSGGYCKNRTFTLVGNPGNGLWTKTGVVTITSSGTNSTTTSVSTGNVAGATSVTYTYTNANGCSSSKTISATIVACATKGILNNEQGITDNEFRVYPNPAHSLFTINCKLLTGSGSIVITDLYGKQLKQQALSIGINTIDVSSFAKGMYLVSVITESSKQTQKVVVE